MAELAQDRIEQSNQVITLPRAWELYNLYSEEARVEALTRGLAHMTKRYGNYAEQSMISILDAPTNWNDVVKRVIAESVTYVSRWYRHDQDAFLVKMAEGAFARREAAAMALFNAALRQDWPKSLPVRASKSRGHRINRARGGGE